MKGVGLSGFAATCVLFFNSVRQERHINEDGILHFTLRATAPADTECSVETKRCRGREQGKKKRERERDARTYILYINTHGF